MRVVYWRVTIAYRVMTLGNVFSFLQLEDGFIIILQLNCVKSFEVLPAIALRTALGRL